MMANASPGTARGDGPELVIAFVAPTGNNFDTVADAFELELHRFDYSTDRIRLSKFLADIAELKDEELTCVDARTRRLQSIGDELRETTCHADALVYAAIREIRGKRIEGWRARRDTETPEEKLAETALRRHAFLVWSLKHPEEAETLRKIYGPRFVLVSTYLGRPQRFAAFVSEIAQSRRATGNEKDFYADAIEILDIDEVEPDNPWGQNVRDAYPEADFFIDATDETTLRATTRRTVDILFGAPYETPTPDEYAMALAHDAGLRSSEPGRQVGAAIVDSRREVIAVGCNEVPRAGGGTYSSTDRYDRRQFKLGGDANERMKAEIATHVFEAFKSEGFIRPTKESATGEEVSRVLSTTRVRDLIEFGRAVHAEMAAVTSAARTGASVDGATMYVTTFPCHLCARLIVAAGIRRVVYIYPYPKSLTAALHDDSVRTDYRVFERDRQPEEPERVACEPFVGVAPRVYQAYFTAPTRKVRGELLKINQRTRIPRRVYEEYSGTFGIETEYLDRERVLIVGSTKWLPTTPEMVRDLGQRLSNAVKRSNESAEKENQNVRKT